MTICGGQLNILKGHNSKWILFWKVLFWRVIIPKLLYRKVIILNIFIPKDHSEDSYPKGSFQILE